MPYEKGLCLLCLRLYLSLELSNTRHSSICRIMKTCLSLFKTKWWWAQVLKSSRPVRLSFLPAERNHLASLSVILLNNRIMAHSVVVVIIHIRIMSPPEVQDHDGLWLLPSCTHALKLLLASSISLPAGYHILLRSLLTSLSSLLYWAPWGHNYLQTLVLVVLIEWMCGA